MAGCLPPLVQASPPRLPALGTSCAQLPLPAFQLTPWLHFKRSLLPHPPSLPRPSPRPQALQGDKEYVAGVEKRLLDETLKGASYGDR